MARQATSTAAAPVTIGKFAFNVVEVASIPADTGRDVTREKHPLRDVFSAMKPNTSVLIPHAFFTASPEEGGRGMKDPSKFTPGYARQKIGDVFKGWVKESAEARSNLQLVFRQRKAGDDNGAGGSFEHDGWAVFLVEKAAGAANG